MKTTTEEFIRRFHSINGTTIGERRKSLFLLLNGIEQTESNQLDFCHLHPKSPLEEKFKLEALIYFKKIPDLLEVLKSENPILIKRILKVFWFLEEAFQNLTGEQLVTLVFPYISFNAKVKIVNKLSFQLKNSQQANALFEAIEKKYGLYLASKLLPACGADVITNCIQYKRIKLTPRQLLMIIKKYPEVTESIIKLISSRDVDVGKEYKNIFLYLAQHDIGQFFKLYTEYKLSFRLGWRKTDKFIQINRQDVIKNPNRYYGLLHNKQIAKSLNQDFKDLYFNLFPKSLDQLGSHHDVFTILKRLPKKMQDINLILTTFETVYGSQLWDHPELINLKLLEMAPPNVRDALVTPENKQNHVSDEEWHCYMKTEKSIPYLKKTISLTSNIGARVNLIRLLIKTCEINGDKEALANICKYMLTKHRNDNVAVRRAFLGALKKTFRLEYLEEQHWSLIHELIQLFTLNNEDFDDSCDFLLGYIHFRLIHKLPIKEQLTEWLKLNTRNLNIVEKEPQYQKQCLLMFGELIPEIFEKQKEGKEMEGEDKKKKGKECDLDSYNIIFVKALIDWNERHPQDRIDILSYSDAMNSLKRSLITEDSKYVIAGLIEYCLRLTSNLEERANLLNLYLTRPVEYLDIKIIKWLVQHEPLIVINHIDVATRFTLDWSYYSYERIDQYFFWKWWKNFTHMEEFQRVVKSCLSEFEKIKECNWRSTAFSNAIIGLSYLMDGEEFKKFIVPYYPTGLRADAKTKESETLYSIQQGIGPCLRNINPPSLAMESILIFCKGDYLKLIQKSLYSVCSNINEDKLPPFFNELAGRAVSIRKHAMHLAFRVLDKEQIYGVLKRFMETEKNASVRKFLLKGIFNFFVINADDYSWKLVKENINCVDVDDKEALEILMQIEKIPPQYTVQYITFTWNILSKLPDPEGNMESNKSRLLRSVTSNIVHLFPKEFCNAVIQNYFFKCDDACLTSFQSDVHTFTCRFIIYCDSRTEQEERLKANFEVVKNFVSSTWHKLEIRERARNYVANFLKEFCLEFLKYSCLDKEILIKFSDLWNNLFKPHQAFNEYLHLQFTLIYVEKLSLTQISQKFASLCHSLADLYGLAIVDMFRKKINFCSRYFLSGTDKVLEENWYILIENLIQPESSIFNLVLVILLLNDHTPTIPETEIKYKAVIELLEKNPDPILQLYLENHFRRGGTTLDFD